MFMKTKKKPKGRATKVKAHENQENKKELMKSLRPDSHNQRN